MSSPAAPVAMRESALPLPLVRRGKVRDVYAAGEDHLLVVATDRVSAFDVVMAEAVPHKGAVLTLLTAWWLRRLEREAGVAHHMLSADAGEIASALPAVAAHADALAGRAMLCLRADVYPVECVVRGYLAGSAWQEYRARGTLAGEPLPPGLRESERLAADPEFTALGVSLDALRAAADPRRFVGRAPEQVDEFLAEVVEPLLAGAGDRPAALDEVRV